MALNRQSDLVVFQFQECKVGVNSLSQTNRKYLNTPAKKRVFYLSNKHKAD